MCGEIINVLNDGYLMIKIDVWGMVLCTTTEPDWFCRHITSSDILPAGYCDSNGIPLTPPKNYNRPEFDWNVYLRETNGLLLPTQFFNINKPENSFQVNMKLEAADFFDPKTIRTAIVTHVSGRLLKIRYGGWDVNSDIWVTCDSVDLYPVGWCEMVSHKLQYPKVQISDKSHVVKQPVSNIVESKPEISNEPIHINQCLKKENSSDSLTSVNFSEDPQNVLPNEQIVLDEQHKIIPRISEYKNKASSSAIVPDSWDVNDVAEFLKINDCSRLCDSFIKQGIDGRKFMKLSKDEVLSLSGMKVGPSLKLQNLINQLNLKTNSNHSKQSKIMKNMSFITTNHHKVFYEVRCTQ